MVSYCCNSVGLSDEEARVGEMRHVVSSKATEAGARIVEINLKTSGTAQQGRDITIIT